MPKTSTQRLRNAVLADIRARRMTVAAIARHHGLSAQTVARWATTAGITPGVLLPAGARGDALEICFRLAECHHWPLFYISSGLGHAGQHFARRWWAKNFPMTPPPTARRTRKPDISRCDMHLLAHPSDQVVGRGMRLSLEERIAIGMMHTVFDFSAAQIGRVLGRARQTISRELHRGRRPDGVYDPAAAHELAHRRRARPKTPKLVANHALRTEVVRLLSTPRTGRIPWHSPALVSKRLRAAYPEDATMTISAESIYQALYVQGQGSLRQELKVEKALRSGRNRRIPQSRLRGAWPSGA